MSTKNPGTSSKAEGEEVKKAKAKELKTKGNEAYKKQDFEKAKSFYKKAIELDPQNATFFSNLSATEYEVGKYREALASIEQALFLIEIQLFLWSESPTNDLSDLKFLRPKLLYRKARCHLQLSQCCEAIGSASKYGNLELDLEKEKGDENEKRDVKRIRKEVEDMMGAAKGLREASNVDKAWAKRRIAQAPFYRPPPKNVREYFRIGHDPANSILMYQRDENENEPVNPTPEEERLNFILPSCGGKKEEKDENEDWEFSAFFGGVGDARHVYASLADVGVQLNSRKQVEEMEMKEQKGKGKKGQTNKKGKEVRKEKETKLHITCNDIKPAPLAKSLIFLLALEELSYIPQEEREGDENERASQLLGTIHMVFWSGIIPPGIYTVFEPLLDKAISVLETPVQTSQPFDLCWLYMEPKTAVAVMNVLRWWKDPKELYRPEQMWFKSNSRSESSRDDGTHGPLSCKRESIRFGQVSILRPPTWCTAESPIETLYQRKGLEKGNSVLALWTRNQKQEQDKAEDDRLIAIMKKHVGKTWRTNPTFLDQAVLSLEITPIVHDPYNVMCELWDNEPMRGREPDAVEGANPRSKGGKYRKRKGADGKAGTLIAWTEKFFSLAAEGLRQARQSEVRIVLEFVAGDAFGMLDQIKLETMDRRDDFPVQFDRIQCSNVPDYAGGYLNSFTVGTALLKPLPTSYFSANAMLNNFSFPSGIFGPFDQYVDSALFTYAAVILEEVAPVFGLNKVSKIRQGGYHYVWQRIPNPPPRLSHPEIKRILHQIWFILTVPPPASSPKRRTNVEPRLCLNIHILFRLFNHLYHIGYPPHIFIDFVQNLLSNNFQTRARPLTEAPPEISTRVDYWTVPLVKFSVTPFLEDLRVAAAMWQSILDFPLWGIEIPSSNDIGRYCVKLPDAELKIDRWLPRHFPHLLLVIASAKDFDHPDGIKHCYSMVMANKPLPPSVHFIQSFQWNPDSEMVSFFLTKKMAESFKKKVDMNSRIEVGLINPICWRLYSKLARWDSVREIEETDVSIDMDALSKSFDARKISRPVPRAECKGWERERVIVSAAMGYGQGVPDLSESLPPGSPGLPSFLGGGGGGGLPPGLMEDLMGGGLPPGLLGRGGVGERERNMMAMMMTKLLMDAAGGRGGGDASLSRSGPGRG